MVFDHTFVDKMSDEDVWKACEQLIHINKEKNPNYIKFAMIQILNNWGLSVFFMRKGVVQTTGEGNVYFLHEAPTIERSFLKAALYFNRWYPNLTEDLKQFLRTEETNK